MSHEPVLMSSLILLQRRQASLGRSFFQMCMISGSISVATSQAPVSQTSWHQCLVTPLSDYFHPWLDGGG